MRDRGVFFPCILILIRAFLFCLLPSPSTTAPLGWWCMASLLDPLACWAAAMHADAARRSEVEAAELAAVAAAEEEEIAPAVRRDRKPTPEEVDAAVTTYFARDAPVGARVARELAFSIRRIGEEHNIPVTTLRRHIHARRVGLPRPKVFALSLLPPCYPHAFLSPRLTRLPLVSPQEKRGGSGWSAHDVDLRGRGGFGAVDRGTCAHVRLTAARGDPAPSGGAGACAWRLVLAAWPAGGATVVERAVRALGRSGRHHTHANHRQEAAHQGRVGTLLRLCDGAPS